MVGRSTPTAFTCMERLHGGPLGRRARGAAPHESGRKWAWRSTHCGTTLSPPAFVPAGRLHWLMGANSAAPAASGCRWCALATGALILASLSVWRFQRQITPPAENARPGRFRIDPPIGAASHASFVDHDWLARCRSAPGMRTVRWAETIDDAPLLSPDGPDESPARIPGGSKSKLGDHAMGDLNTNLFDGRQRLPG